MGWGEVCKDEKKKTGTSFGVREKPDSPISLATASSQAFDPLRPARWIGRHP